MIVTIYGIIFFRLLERISIIAKSRKAVMRYFPELLCGFSYQAIPTRHEVCIKPYLQEEYII